MLALRLSRLRLLVVALYALTLAFVGLMQPIRSGFVDAEYAALASLPGGADVSICSHDDSGAAQDPVKTSHACHDLCLVCCIGGLEAVAELAVPLPDGVPMAARPARDVAAIDLWRARSNARGPPRSAGLA